MFEWLNTIFDWVWGFKPILDILPPTEGGVKFKPGGKIELMKPGHLYMYWPVTTCILTLETKRQSIEVQQELTTKDHETVMVKTVIVFTVDDVMKALVETTDFDDTTEEMGQKGTVRAVMSRKFDQILKDMVEGTEIRNEVAQGARSALRPFGVKVEDAFISSFAKTKVFSHMGDGMAIDLNHDEDHDE